MNSPCSIYSVTDNSNRGEIQGKLANEATFPVHFPIFLPPRSAMLHMFGNMFQGFPWGGMTRLFSFSIELSAMNLLNLF